MTKSIRSSQRQSIVSLCGEISAKKEL